MVTRFDCQQQWRSIFPKQSHNALRTVFVYTNDVIGVEVYCPFHLFIFNRYLTHIILHDDKCTSHFSSFFVSFFFETQRANIEKE